MKKITPYFFLAAALSAAVALSGCSGKSKTGMTPVTLNEVAHSVFYAPQYAAIELGYFTEEGLDLTLVNGAGADKVMTALLSGDADIGFMGSEASIYTGLYCQFCPADPKSRKLPCGKTPGSFLFLAKAERNNGSGRKSRRNAPDGF